MCPVLNVEKKGLDRPSGGLAHFLFASEHAKAGVLLTTVMGPLRRCTATHQSNRFISIDWPFPAELLCGSKRALYVYRLKAVDVHWLASTTIAHALTQERPLGSLHRSQRTPLARKNMFSMSAAVIV